MPPPTAASPTSPAEMERIDMLCQWVPLVRISLASFCFASAMTALGSALSKGASPYVQFVGWLLVMPVVYYIFPFGVLLFRMIQKCWFYLTLSPEEAAAKEAAVNAASEKDGELDMERGVTKPLILASVTLPESSKDKTKPKAATEVDARDAQLQSLVELLKQEIERKKDKKKKKKEDGSGSGPAEKETMSSSQDKKTLPPARESMGGEDERRAAPLRSSVVRSSTLRSKH